MNVKQKSILMKSNPNESQFECSKVEELIIKLITCMSKP